jgi:hypothetical protein
MGSRRRDRRRAERESGGTDSPIPGVEVHDAAGLRPIMILKSIASKERSDALRARFLGTTERSVGAKRRVRERARAGHRKRVAMGKPHVSLPQAI